jgi:hypothetical protein
VILRAARTVDVVSWISPDWFSVCAVSRRLSANVPMLLTTWAPSSITRLMSKGSREATTSLGRTGGAAALPTLSSMIRSPSRPWVSMRATESLRTRSPKRRAMVMSTRTLPPGSEGRVTPLTRPICTPASRTVAPSTSPPTSVNSAEMVKRGSNSRARAPSA